MREGKLRSFQSFLVKSPFILSKHLRIRSAAISARQGGGGRAQENASSSKCNNTPQNTEGTCKRERWEVRRVRSQPVGR